MKRFKTLLAVFTMLFAATAATADPADEGYTLLNPPQPTNSGVRIEVLEFFFYGCIHCHHLHPALDQWEKNLPGDVQVEHVPVAFNPNWEPMAYTFYALKAMGKLAQLDDKLYDAWNVDNLRLVNRDTIADFVAKHGVDRQRFLGNYDSFSVQSDVKRSKQMMLDYKIEGTPTLVVDGKYVISGLGPDETIRVLNEVIQKARLEHKR
jgi:thiol:disulfide interchange protein DsbA